MPSPARFVAAVVLPLCLVVAGCSSGSDTADDPAPDSSDSAATPDETGAATPSVPAGDVTTPPDPALARFYSQDVAWSACNVGECGTLTVPVDYDDPEGETVDLSLARTTAGDPDERIGSLVLNPGGPGGSGVDYLASFYQASSEELTDHYDMVGFDPRGVGRSAPLQCLTDPQLDAFVELPPAPDTPEEVADTERLTSLMGRSCLRRSGELAAHVSTVEVARDVDVLRSALGDATLSYAGASYGTFIGATYAELFPDRVGRMVLDGAVDPAETGREASLGQAEGFDTALTAYAEDCVADGDCPLGGSAEEVVAGVDEFLTGLGDEPISSGDPQRPLVQGLGVYGVIITLYNESTWPLLTDALEQAYGGDGSGLLNYADQYLSRTSEGYADNSAQVILAVNCLDSPSDATAAEVEAGVGEFEADAPVFGDYLAWGELTCASWPIEPAQTAPEIDGSGAAPIVVVGTTRDPATPYESAIALADELDSGVFLSRDGDGHTAYHMGNECIDDTLDAYLVEGAVPDDGTEC